VPDWDDAGGEQEAVTRSFWSGTITFGLVSIPVALYAANRSQRVSLRMVTEDGTPLARRYFTSRDDRELDADDIVRGYEIEKDRFVIVDDDELERLAPERTRDIDLRQFVDASEIDPMYFERAYYLTPAGQSNKAYRLLARVMEETGRAGIATFVMRTREYLVAIMANNGILRAETLRFADELRSPADIGLPEPAEPDAAAVKRMDREIGKQLEQRLDTRELADDGVERIRKLVSAKVKAGEDVFDAPEEDAERPTDVIDLMEILKRRLQGQTEEEDTARESRPAARKTASKKPRASAGKSSSASKSKTSTAKRPKSSSAKKPGRAASSSRKDADLGDASKADLLKRAQKLDIPGRSGMSKDELVKAIRRSA
jgi:DNA end-binding protein Ku